MSAPIALPLRTFVSATRIAIAVIAVEAKHYGAHMAVATTTTVVIAVVVVDDGARVAALGLHSNPIKLYDLHNGIVCHEEIV